jgi:capsule biosynthesis phosphatase
MRIVIDLDGVICPIKQPDESYTDLLPLPGAAEKIRTLRAAGHCIIIQTARHMKTCEGNVGLVVRKIGQITLDWLTRHGIEYDEIHFGKPNGQVYIDDRGLRFENWEAIDETRLQEVARER